MTSSLFKDMASAVPFVEGEVRGVLHPAGRLDGPGLVLTHGAGGDCHAPLVEAGNAFAAAGIAVLRCDLAFRQRRPAGPPRGSAAADRASLRAAAAALRRIVHGPVFLGGHSYGGRQASMLAADEPGVAAALLLFSYPLHPPKKPEQLRTEHFPRLRTRTVFVHGSADGFATGAELEAAVALIPAATRVIRIAGAGHDLKRGRIDYAPIVAEFVDRAG